MNRQYLDPVGLLQTISRRRQPVSWGQSDCDELMALLLALAILLEMPALSAQVSAVGSPQRAEIPSYIGR